MAVSQNHLPESTPRWLKICLQIASVQCLIWGLFIILFPSLSSTVYGFSRPPQQLFLWQGMGLIIFLFGIVYMIAATNPRQHWAVVLMGLLAKFLGPIGMLWSVLHNDVSWRVLILIPMNDIIWWLPFGLILKDVFLHSKRTAR